jgi:hypothetical protein
VRVDWFASDELVSAAGRRVGRKPFSLPCAALHPPSSVIGRQSNRSAIGARIHVKILENDKQHSIYRHVNSGGSFGCNPLRKNIGLGKAEKIESIEVYWPTADLAQTFRNVAMDQTIQIIEGENRYTTRRIRRIVLGSRD